MNFVNFNRLAQIPRLRIYHTKQNPNLFLAALKSLKKAEIPEIMLQFSSKATPTMPVNPLKEVYSANQQRVNGVIYDKKPFKMRCEAGKTYLWCLCGQSKSQPLCDGTHKNIYLKIKIRPIKFTVPETKDYWLCNCKQTINRPFCDGTHKRPDIQALNK